jgi:hypothetical protein
MQRRFFNAMLLLTLCLCIESHSSWGQSEKQKFEVGGQVSPLRPKASKAGVTFGEERKTVPGFGGRFGYNISKRFTLEAESNFFPRDRDVEGGRKIQGLFGVKAGRRFDRVGLFAKARPGFIRYEKGD